jgi:hypothetical protein
VIGRNRRLCGTVNILIVKRNNETICEVDLSLMLSQTEGSRYCIIFKEI